MNFLIVSSPTIETYDVCNMQDFNLEKYCQIELLCKEHKQEAQIDIIEIIIPLLS